MTSAGAKIYILFAILSAGHEVSGGKILLMTLDVNDGQFLLLKVAGMLAMAGHECTLLLYGSANDSRITEVLDTLPEAVDLIIKPRVAMDPLVSKLDNQSAAGVSFQDLWENYPVYTPDVIVASHLAGCNAFIEDNHLLHILKTRQFDVAMVTLFLNDQCLLPLAYEVGLPVVGFVVNMMENAWVYYQAGIPLPLSYLPVLNTSLTEDMSFGGRIKNVWRWVLFERAVRKYWQVPAASLITNHWPESPPLGQLYQQLSLLFINSEPVVDYIHPIMPSLIHLGTFYCSHPDNLPKILLDFALQFKNGVIYVSLDNPYSPLPAHIETILLETFQHLSHGIIWKHHSQLNSSRGNVSENIWVQDKFPEQDILGHPRTKLYICSCSQTNVLQGIFYSVPMVCIPITSSDQQMAARALHLGIAVQLDKRFLTTQSLKATINSVVKNKRYQDNVRHFSEDIRDQPISAQEKLIYWVEYVIRHKGHTHLRSPAADKLNLLQYYLVDVLMFVILSGLLCIAVVVTICLFSVRVVLKPIKQKDE